MFQLRAWAADDYVEKKYANIIYLSPLNKKCKQITHKCNDINWCYEIVQLSFTLLRNKEIPTLLPITDCWVFIMPRDVDLLRNFLKPKRTDFNEIRLNWLVGEFVRIGPVEEVDIHVKWLRRWLPELFINWIRLKHKLLRIMRTC